MPINVGRVMSKSLTGIAFTVLRRYLGGSPLFWTGLGVFVLTVLIVNPRRETALDDDWVCAITVRNLLNTGSYKLYQWGQPNILFQAYWGRLFAGLFGYSFTSLRGSTLVLTFVGLLAFYGLARA